MMRRLTVFTAALTAALALSSCDMQLGSATTNAKLEEAIKKATTPAATTPTTVKKPTTPTPKPSTPPPSSSSESNQFLWKPISESTGTLAIHLPAYYNGKVSRVTVNGESGRFGGYHNPNRSLWRYSKKGAAYGKNVSIVATGSVTKTWTVANGAVRTIY